MSRCWLRIRRCSICLLALASWTVAGCDLGSGPSPVPARIELFEGADQTGTVFQAIPVSPAVRVVSAKGKPVKDQEVVFSVASGGGHVSGNVVQTDRNGEARVGTWILGTVAGTQSLQARAADLPPLLILATAEPGDPAKLEVVEGDGQTGVVGGPLDSAPVVRLTDVYRNPIPGVTVGFQINKGGGYVGQGQPETDKSGEATTGPWTLGTTPGLHELTGSVPGVPAVTLRAMAVAGAPDRVTVLLGDGQRGQVGTVLPLRPTLVITDRFGNLLEGIAVTFQVTSGGGSIAEGSYVSDRSGAVVAGRWTLGPEAGIQTLQVLVPGIPPLTLTATADPGPATDALIVDHRELSATVGTGVDPVPSLLVVDAFGNPVGGVTVTFVPTSAPAGSDSQSIVEGAETATDPNGRAAASAWVLGTMAGEYVLEGRVAGLERGVEFRATALADVPSVLTRLGGDGQAAQAGTAVSEPLSVGVLDRYGNPAPEAPVTFKVVEGGGTTPWNEVQTDKEGIGRMDGWVLGPIPGPNRISASVQDVGSVTFHATGLVANPHAILKVSGDGQEVQVGTMVPHPPRVKVVDDQENPVPEVQVEFVVVQGGGAVAGSMAVTDQDGLAEAGAWTLGTRMGVNQLQARVHNLPSVTFSAQALPGPPATMVAVAGEGQEVRAGTYLPVSPAVRLLDDFGNPVSGREVVFSILSGGGSVAEPAVVTDPSGFARVGRWTLGSLPGTNELAASASGLETEVFEAVGVPPGGLQIELVYLTPVDPDVSAVFDAAGGRWEEILVGDLRDFVGTLPAGGCQPEEVDGVIDDVRVYVSVSPIDSVGGVLGRAGPCYYRRSPVRSPVTGIMMFDEADLANMLSSGLLEDVIVHEMGHVLGVGSLWNRGFPDLLVGAGGSDPVFIGAGARTAFDQVGGLHRTDPKVPVENTGGPGTRDSHWRESVHNAELMTGWIEGNGAPNPLSIITIASLADLGYAVDMTAADPYVLFDPLGVSPRPGSGSRVFLRELPPPTPIPVDPGGGGP